MKNKEVIKNVPSEEKIKEWNEKETIEGSQSKADKALNDAKAYADEHKVEKVPNKQLSTEDFTTEEKTKLALMQNYTHPLKHTTDEIATNSGARFVSDAQIKDWNDKETTIGSKAKADKALEDSKIYIDSKVNPLISNKLDFAEINQSRQLVLKSNGVIKYTLQLPLGGGDGSSSYVLPPATSTLLGGVKIGAGISIKDDGTISVNMSDIGSLDWENISGKPLEFSPASHTHNRSDITGLFNIINNLQSNSETDALSAKQGKVLNEKIVGLEETVQTVHTHVNKEELDKISVGKVAEWDAKETVTGSQEKVDTGVQATKAYTDERVNDLIVNTSKKITVSDLTLDDATQLFKATVKHDLNSNNLFVDALNTTTKKSESISFKVIDENNIEIYAEDGDSLDLLIIGEGTKIATLQSGAIVDSSTAAESTWSSQKINQEIEALKAQIQALQA